MEKIVLENNSVRMFEDTFVYLQTSFNSFDIDLLHVNINIDESIMDYFQILYSYSFDKINYADFKVKSEFVIDNPGNISYYIAIYFKKITPTDLQKPLTLYQQQNVNNINYHIQLDSLVYSDLEPTTPPIIEYKFTDESLIKFQSLYEIVNQFPKWNFYDGQSVTVNRWLNQCNAIAEMYGHTCIYFKTEPVESEIVHTFANRVFRNVTSIKKLHILSPGNELPQDRVVYSDWDMPLQDDFVIHVVKQKFEQAFGENTLPLEKDYLFFPLINKLFRVAAVQPKNGFMGKIGWWETFLSKFEDDECIGVADGLKDSMESSSDFDAAIDVIDNLDDTIRSEVFRELEIFKNDTVQSVDKFNKVTVEEKKLPTQNFTNKLVDSTNYVALKETEKLREYYNNRLQIVSINPDTSAFPISMYDNGTVNVRTVAMQYNLTDFSTKNKFDLTVTTRLTLNFNYILSTKFAGEIFDLLNDTGVLSLFTLKSTRNKNFEIVDNNYGKTFLVNYALTENELYNINLEFDIALKQWSIKIFILNNNEKTLAYQNIYINDEFVLSSFIIGYVHMFGGSYYSNDITYSNNDKVILKDYVNPLLSMKQF